MSIPLSTQKISLFRRSRVIPNGCVRLVVTMATRFVPCKVDFSIFGGFPQSVQNINLSNKPSQLSTHKFPEGEKVKYARSKGSGLGQ